MTGLDVIYKANCLILKKVEEVQFETVNRMILESSSKPACYARHTLRSTTTNWE